MLVSTRDHVKVVRFVLDNNYYEFNGDVKKSFRNSDWYKVCTALRVYIHGWTWNQVLQSQSLQPLLWFRRINDIFFIWTHVKYKLEMFLDDLNSLDNSIKFIHKFNKESVTFLNLIVKLSKGLLTTDLHIKNTDWHQYLHFNSSHPDHTEISIIYSQALRLTKIYTFENDFFVGLSRRCS